MRFPVYKLFISIFVFILLISCQDTLTHEEFSDLVYPFDNAFEDWDYSAGTLIPGDRGGEDHPYVDSSQVSDGDYSVIFGNGTSSFKADVSFPQEVLFHFSYNSTGYGSYLDFKVNNEIVISKTYSGTDWTESSLYLPAGEYSLEWDHRSNSNTPQVRVDGIRASVIPNFNEAFDEWDESLGRINSISRDGDYLPYMDSSQASDGTSSVIFGVEKKSGSSSFQADVTFLQDTHIRFKYKRSDSGGNIYFRVDNETLLDTTYEEADWTEVSYFIPAGNHILEWEHSKHYDAWERAWIDGIMIGSVVDFEGAFEEWDDSIGTLNSSTRSGNWAPILDSTQASEGAYSILFGVEEPSGRSGFQANVTFPQDALLFFKYRSPQGDANVKFTVDNQSCMNEVSHTDEWAEVVFYIPAGDHDLAWEHNKYYDGDERVWIDGIRAVIPPDISQVFEEWDHSLGTINSTSRSESNAPFVVPNRSADGVYSMVFNGLERPDSSSFRSNVSLSDDVFLSYKYRRSGNFGDFYFRIDDVTRERFWTLTPEWKEVSYFIPSGDHSLEWELFIDTSGIEWAWLDGIRVRALPNFFDEAFEDWNHTMGTLNSITRSGYVYPYIDSSQAHSGNSSIKFGVEGPTGSSSFQANVSFLEDVILHFKYKRSEGGADINFRVDNQTMMSSRIYAQDWTEIAYFIPAGEHLLEWEHLKRSDGTERAWIDDIVASPMDAFFTEWNASAATLESWALAGDLSPFVQNEKYHSGNSALRFGDITHYGSSTFTMTITVDSDSTLSFHYSVSSESGDDYLNFYINGTRILNSSGEVGWTQRTASLPRGTHSLVWEYTKDNYGNGGSDTAWLDSITVY